MFLCGNISSLVEAPTFPVWNAASDSECPGIQMQLKKVTLFIFQSRRRASSVGHLLLRSHSTSLMDFGDCDFCISKSIHCIRWAVISFFCVQAWIGVSDTVASNFYRELETHGMYVSEAKEKAGVILA